MIRIDDSVSQTPNSVFISDVCWMWRPCSSFWSQTPQNQCSLKMSICWFL